MFAFFGRVAGDDIPDLLERRRGCSGLRSTLKRVGVPIGLRIQNVRAFAPSKKHL